MFAPRIKVDPGLYAKLKKGAAAAGYASVEEFVRHVLEREVARLEQDEDRKMVDERLRGLGYIT